jgi:Protein of unknown function (DUF2939)
MTKPSPSGTTRIAIGVASLLVFAVVVWLFVAPALAANDLQNALRDNDPIGINKTVDFPSLRDNLRVTLSSNLAAQNGTSTLEPAQALQSAFAGLIAGPIIDAIVTPAGLSALFKGGIGSLNGDANATIRVSSGLQSLDRYAVTLTDANNSENVVTLILMPRGLQWKLVSIGFPPNTFKR